MSKSDKITDDGDVLSILVILFLKHLTSSRITHMVYLISLILSILVLVFRIWAAGFIGSTARTGETHADVLITADVDKLEIIRSLIN